MTKEMNSFILNEIDEKIMKNVLTEARCQSPLHIETEVILVDLIVNGDELIARNEIIIQKEQELNLMKEWLMINAIFAEEEKDEVDTVWKNYRDSTIKSSTTSNKETEKTTNKGKKPQKKTKAAVPYDPFILKVLKFFYTFGIVACEVMNFKENIVYDFSSFNDQQNIKINYW